LASRSPSKSSTSDALSAMTQETLSQTLQQTALGVTEAAPRRPAVPPSAVAKLLFDR
jgi:hypothetical protein